jgi:hypothetical protein
VRRRTLIKSSVGGKEKNEKKENKRGDSVDG